VAVEGQPFLFHCPILPGTPFAVDLSLEFASLSGNLLDVTIADGVVIVSVDNIHTPGSIKDVDTSTVGYISLSSRISLTFTDTKVKITGCQSFQAG
jgi:hypothetical protein